MKNAKIFSAGTWLFAFVVILWTSLMLIYQPWKKNQVINDVVSYYGYLPAAIIHHDLKLDFLEKKKPGYKYIYWPEKASNGGKVIKTTMGLSLLYAPFFLIGHVIAGASGAIQDGFSMPYQMSVIVGGLFYFLAGLYFLRKILLRYFSEKVTVITILSLVTGTNLFCYAMLDNMMSHQYVFALLSVFIHQSLKWHEDQKLKTAIFIGISGGLLILIRPPMIFCIFIFVLYNVYDRDTLKEKCKLLLPNKASLLIMIGAAALVFMPQLLYWKYVTGQWFFVSYVNERFYFDQPHLLEGLFGFRKGWFLYTPLMLFSVFGLFSLKKKIPSLFFPVTLVLVLTIYVFLSWWCWWYGGSFGNRAFIDWYPLFIFPVAAIYSDVLMYSKRILKTMFFFVIFLLACLNVFQTWQYSKEYLHYDSMTAKAYRLGFFATSSTTAWEEALDEPAYGRAVKGLAEAYSEEEIKSIRAIDDISLKAANRLIVTCDLKGSKELHASWNRVSASEVFYIIHKEGNKVALMSRDKYYVSADLASSGKLVANRLNASDWEIFELIYLGNNRIALKADNNKYVNIDTAGPFTLKANSDTITPRCMFRIYIN